jgi:hypothetical protein
VKVISFLSLKNICKNKIAMVNERGGENEESVDKEEGSFSALNRHEPAFQSDEAIYRAVCCSISCSN